MEQGQRIAERLEPVDPIELPDLVRKHGKVQLCRQVAPRVYAKRGRPRHGSCWERHARKAHREEGGPCHRKRSNAGEKGTLRNAGERGTLRRGTSGRAFLCFDDRYWLARRVERELGRSEGD